MYIHTYQKLRKKAVKGRKTKDSVIKDEIE